MASSIVIPESNLQGFFFEELKKVNDCHDAPLSDDILHYLSFVMDKFTDSENYFEEVEGRVREKILGVKLLECHKYSKTEQKRILQDIGDTALFLCGLFTESLNKKLVSDRYYQEVGQTAYGRLNALVPSIYEQSDFFSMLSRRFNQLVMFLGLVSKKTFQEGPDESFFVVNRILMVS